MHFKRLLYFSYYLRQLDKKKFKKFLRIAKNNGHKSSLSILIDIFFSSLKYNISILDYFYFRFYNLNKIERDKWAGTGYMYEYQLLMNPKGAREVLENKIMFLNYFSNFVKRKFASINQLTKDKGLVNQLLGNTSGRLVLKGSRGQVGAEVEVVNCKEYTQEELLRTMNSKGYDLAEEYVVQHPALMELSPSGLNTVRIFTQKTLNDIDFLGARLRVSVNSPVDNMAAGNLAAPIDMESGIVSGPGVYSDISKSDESVHPVTKKPVLSFKIPFWREVTNLAIQAAILCPDNKSVGWDIAITSDGPELIEGNHNWCKLLWQLPVKQGLKGKLEKYL
jgi:hypothetical protein